MDDSIIKRAKINGDEEEIRQRTVLSPRIVIHNYSSLVDLELVQTSAGVPDDDGVFFLTIQNCLTKQLRRHGYDVIICATGYDRSSWFQLLRRSELGKHFILGDLSSSTPVDIFPEHAQECDSHSQWPTDLTVDTTGMRDNSTPTSSSISTPPTSRGSSSPVPSGHSGCRDIVRGFASRVYITRAYRLVPQDSGVEPLPRIYVQGCTEATHGLSDTLLSVISIRAGEIADDLIKT